MIVSQALLCTHHQQSR